MLSLTDISYYLYNWVSHLEYFWTFLTNDILVELHKFTERFITQPEGFFDILFGFGTAFIEIIATLLFAGFDGNYETVTLLDIILGSSLEAFVLYTLFKWL